MCNIIKNNAIAPTHFLSAFVQYGKRYRKIPYLLWRISNNSLWRIVVNSSILSKARIQAPVANIHEILLKTSTVSGFRTNCVYILLHNLRSATYSQYNPATIQRCIQKLLGVKTFLNPTTIKRFLHQLSPKAICQIVKVQNLLQQKLWDTPSLN
jgi:hypothetical protein